MRFHCNIHNINFDYDNPKNYPMTCPLCMYEEIERLRAEHHVVRQHRDVLVEAIGIVKSIKEIQ